MKLTAWKLGFDYDDVRAVFDSQAAFSSRSNVGKRLRAALDFLDNGFDADTGKVLRNRTVVQSLLTLACRLLRSSNIGGQEKRIAALFTTFLHELNRQVELGRNATDRDYLEFQRTINANIKEGARIRHQILIRKFLAHDPAVANLLDPASITESVNKKEIAAVADPIIKRVGEINEQYAAQHGKDLFKATNRTVQAQTNLSKTIADFDGYKSFIGDLYFLFWESVGSRLDGRMPPSFEDVKMLRTGLQHDVDHGRGTRVKAKKLKIGQVFKKYAGAPSPAGLDPERFLLVQANLLDALRRDLQQMKP